MSTHRENVVAVGLGARSAVTLLVVGLMAATLIALASNQARPSGPSHDVGAPAAVPAAENAKASAIQADDPPDQKPDVRDVESAKGAAVNALVARYGTTECFMVANVLRQYPPDYAERLDQLISEAQIGTEGWIDGRRIWVGTVAGAAEAFDATEAFTDRHDSVWIVMEPMSGPRAYELLKVESKSGRPTWQLGDQIAKCDSADPASDDDEDAG